MLQFHLLFVGLLVSHDSFDDVEDLPDETADEGENEDCDEVERVEECRTDKQVVELLRVVEFYIAPASTYADL